MLEEKPTITKPSAWAPPRMRVGTVIAGERIIHHAPQIDVFGRWFGLFKLGIEAERRYPDVLMWCQALKDKNPVVYYYTDRAGAHSFGGQLWILYKE